MEKNESQFKVKFKKQLPESSQQTVHKKFNSINFLNTNVNQKNELIDSNKFKNVLNYEKKSWLDKTDFSSIINSNKEFKLNNSSLNKKNFNNTISSCKKEKLVNEKSEQTVTDTKQSIILKNIIKNAKISNQSKSNLTLSKFNDQNQVSNKELKLKDELLKQSNSMLKIDFELEYLKQNRKQKL